MNTNWKAVLDWRKLILIFPLVTLWCVPVFRAINFIGYAKNVYADEQSLNASNDVSYGVGILITYLLCLLMEIGLCLLLARKNLFATMFLLSMPVWIVIQIIRFKPEEVIVLFPTFNSVRPLMWNLIALVFGLGSFGLYRLKTHKLGNARTN
jgi:hypothetical protein